MASSAYILGDGALTSSTTHPRGNPNRMLVQTLDSLKKVNEKSANVMYRNVN